MLKNPKTPYFFKLSFINVRTNITNVVINKDNKKLMAVLNFSAITISTNNLSKTVKLIMNTTIGRKNAQKALKPMLGPLVLPKHS